MAHADIPLPDYTFCPMSGAWVHRNGIPTPPRSLSDLSYRGGRMEYRARHSTEPEWALAGHLQEAKKILARAANAGPPDCFQEPEMSLDFKQLRWFPLPREVFMKLTGQTVVHEIHLPGAFSEPVE